MPANKLLTAPEIDRINTVRRQLLAGGYSPIPVKGKRPHMYGWQKARPGPYVVANWSRSRPDETNTGLQTRLTPALDIDIMKVSAAKSVEALVRKRFIKGRILVRIGLAPKRCIPFRCDQPFSKIRVELTAPNGVKHAIEMLGDGQQFVVHGIHEDTHRPYRWIGGTPWEVERAKLPLINQKKAQRLVDAAAAMLVERFGFVIDRRNHVDRDDNPFAQYGRHDAPTIYDVIAKLRKIDPDCSYTTWFQVGCAVYHTLGDDVGFLVFDEWSRSAKYKYDIYRMSPMWESIRRGNYNFTFGTLVHYSVEGS
jgi:hypothetical protein